MAFVKERIPEADKELFNSFDVYDYDNSEEHTKWYPNSKWVVDRERGIYFFYVSGGHHLEQHPYEQYDLVWKGKKVVVLLQGWGNYDTGTDGSVCSYYTYDIVSIRAPKEFKPQQQEMEELIEEAIKVNHSINITNRGIYKNNNIMEIKTIAAPEYLDEVK